MLISFVAQLIGHNVSVRQRKAPVARPSVCPSLTISARLYQLHEEFQAKPLVFHGFVAAPALEFRSLFYRVGALPVECADVMEEVESVRARARRGAGSSPLSHGSRDESSR